MRAAILCWICMQGVSCLTADSALVLSSGYGKPAGVTYLNLYLTQPLEPAVAAVQWTLNYSPASIVQIIPSPGPAALAAQKALDCSAGYGSYSCILAGLNTTALQSGVVAVFAIRLAEGISGNVPVGVGNALEASPDASPLPLGTSDGVIFLSSPYETMTTNISPGAMPLANPQAVALDSSGDLFIADTLNNRIIAINPKGESRVAAGLGSAGYSGDGGMATAARLNRPTSVAIDPSGSVYVADSRNNVIRKFTINGAISTVAGNGTSGWSGDSGPAALAQLDTPSAVAVDALGNLYIADTNSNRIRWVSADGQIISTIAGTGSAAFSGDNGPAVTANLSFPAGIAVDASGYVYVSDSGNNRIRRFTPGANILTVAGGGACCDLGDGNPATAANLNNPAGIAVDSSGNLYVADSGNNRIRMVTPQDGIIVTVAGTGVPSSGANQFNWPRGVAVDSHGDLYVADTNNSRVEGITVFSGSVSSGSASGAPGAIVHVPLTVNLSPGISIDSLGVTAQFSAGSGQLSFTPSPGISPPSVSSTSVPGNIALAWNGNLASGNRPAISGTFLLGTIGVPIPANAAIGSLFSISIAQVGGDITSGDGRIEVMPLAAGPAGILLVQACNYLVGDAYPVIDSAKNNSCGRFGDNQITFEDVIVALRAWGGTQGYAVPNCNDLFDALDAFPPDNPNASPPVVGGDGQLTLADVQTTMNRWANLDPLRPQRPSGSYLRFSGCAAALAPSVSPQTLAPKTVRVRGFEAPPGGTVTLGAVEVQGDAMRVPVYLRASQPLIGWGLLIGWAEPVDLHLRFSAAQMTPTVLDAGVPSRVTVTWLRRIESTAGRWILLGYLEWDQAQGSPRQLAIYKAEAAAENGMALKLDYQKAALQ